MQLPLTTVGVSCMYMKGESDPEHSVCHAAGIYTFILQCKFW